MGIGPVGLMAVAGAVLAGASRILAIGTRPNCVEVAKSYGATDIVSYKDFAIRKGMMSLYGLKDLDRCTFEKYRKRYSPYGTIASLYLWHLSENGG